jgi:hypothetical protein
VTATIIPVAGLRLCRCGRGAATIKTVGLLVCEPCSQDIARTMVRVAILFKAVPEPSLDEVLCELLGILPEPKE